MANCICCGAAERFSVVLAVGPANNTDLDRYYIPNQAVREAMGGPMDPTEIVPFCGACMRYVEDNLRASILYLQQEKGLVSTALKANDGE